MSTQVISVLDQEGGMGRTVTQSPHTTYADKGMDVRILNLAVVLLIFFGGINEALQNASGSTVVV